MAYITQYEIDKQADARRNAAVDQLQGAIGMFAENENRRRALDEKRKLEDLALAKDGISQDAIQAFRSSGDLSGISKLYEQQRADKAKREAEDYQLNKRVKEAQIKADLAAAAGKNLPPEQTPEYKMYVAKKEYDNKNLKMGKNAQEFDSRMQNILGEADNLRAMIQDKGTYEAFGPHNEQLAQKIDSIAIDAAKLYDPESVARESEVAAFKKMLFEPGTLTTRNDSAIALIDSFKKQIQDRAARASGQQPQVTESPAPQAQVPPQIQQKVQQYTPEQKAARLQQLKAKQSQAAMR